MKRYISLALSIVIMLSSLLLSGCGVFIFNVPGDGVEETTVPEEETTAPEPLDVIKGDYATDVDLFMKDLTETDYSGAVARIVSTRKSLIHPDEKTSKTLSEDLAERNEAVEETLGITLVSNEREVSVMLQEIRAAVKSDTYYADIVMYPQSYIGAFVSGGAIINLKSLPGFETDGGYYYKTGVCAGTGGDAVYAVAGPASLDADSLSCIFFNKKMIEATGLESPYKLVDRGEWTIDKYTQYVTAGGALEGDYYGYGAQNTVTYLSDLFFFGAGERLTESSLGYYPQITVNSGNGMTVIEKIRAATVNAESSGSALSAIDSFNSGNTLFLIERVDTMKALSQSVDWGVLPMPKYSEEQEKYITLAPYEDALFMSAVPTAPNYAMTADVIACTNIMSYGYTKDAYVTNATYYYLRDNESIRMLDTVVSNPVYDFSYSFASSYNSIPSATFMAVRNAVSGVSTIERYLNMWSRQFENSMYYLFDVES